MDIGIIFAFIASITRTFKDIGYKAILEDTGSLEAVFCFWLFTLIFLIPLAIRRWVKFKREGKVIIPDKVALWSLIGCGVANIFANWAFMEALKQGDFSVVMPLRNIVPIFTLAIGILIFKEKVGTRIAGATFLVVLGAMVIHSGSGFQAIFKGIAETPSLLAIFSAFLFSFAILAQKYGTGKEHKSMDILLYTTGTIIVMGIGYALAVILKGSLNDASVIIADNWPALIFVGALGAVGSLATFKAFAVGQVTRITPALRAQVLLGIVLGGAFFKEEYLALRIFGGVLLTIGIILIVLPKKEKT